LNAHITHASLLALCLVSSLAAQPPAQPPAQQPLKPLRWGADADGGVPYVFRDPKNPEKMIGFEVDIAEALARELERPIEFEQRKFENLLLDLDRGDIDLAMNGIEVLPDRIENYRLTKPYYVYQLQFIVRADSPIKTVEEIKDRDLLVGTLTGAASVRYLNDENVRIRNKTYDDQDGVFEDLRAKVIDAALMDLPIALYYAAPDPFLKYGRQSDTFRFLGNPLAEGYYAIAVKKDSATLHEELDAALAKLRASGELKRILHKWELWNADQYRLATVGAMSGPSTGIAFRDYMPLLLEGAWTTVRLTFLGMAVAVCLGLPIALMRLYGPAPLRWFATGYVEFFRGIPVLLLLYFIYYGIPGMIPELKLGPEVAAVLGFGLNYAAYEAEIYRAGIGSIQVGQWEAAASLGMSAPLTFRRIILPQALRVILPPMTNDLVALFKDTSVVSIIAVTELSKQYQVLTKSGGGYLQIGITTAILYLIMSVPLGYLSRSLELRWGAKR
jgi:polar amino acid transport system substrate-binding protein